MTRTDVFLAAALGFASAAVSIGGVWALVSLSPDASGWVIAAIVAATLLGAASLGSLSRVLIGFAQERDRRESERVWARGVGRSGAFPDRLPDDVR